MDNVFNFLAAHVVDFVTMAVVYIIGHGVLFFISRRFADKTGKHTQGGRLSKRAQTVVRLIYGIGHTVLILIILIWLLRLINVDPTPILASAGVVGLALGFGAQTLVRDLLSGLFILAENQYGIGDRVKVNGTEGTVSHISIRSTVLTDSEGSHIYIPNGSITIVINMGPAEK